MEVHVEAMISKGELAEVKKRVTRVQSLLRKSAALWLDVAKEFVEAKSSLKQRAYERFVSDVGFTIGVANKLIGIGKCKRLYQAEAAQFIGFVEGWSTLYEVSKLEDHEIDQLWNELATDSKLRLSRAVVQSVASGHSAADKNLVYVTIDGQESAVSSLTPKQIQDFEGILDELKHMGGGSGSVFRVHVGKEAIKKLEVQKGRVSNDPNLSARKAA